MYENNFHKDTIVCALVAIGSVDWCGDRSFGLRIKTNATIFYSKVEIDDRMVDRIGG